MKLITMIEVSDASEEDEHKIAKLLTVSQFLQTSWHVIVLMNGRFHTSSLLYLHSRLWQVCGQVRMPYSPGERTVVSLANL